MACPQPDFCTLSKLCRVDTDSKSEEEVAMVSLYFSLICRTIVEMELRSIMGMLTLNSASSASKVLTLDATTWPRGFVWKSWPTSLRPA